MNTVTSANSSKNSIRILTSDENARTISSHATESSAGGLPTSPSDASSPSLDDDSDSEDSDSGSGEPSLQMMGETHMRLKKLKDSQSQLGLAIPINHRMRMVSDPMARLGLGERERESQASTPQPAQSLPSAPVDIPFSPAMAFLAGFSPLNMPRSLSPTVQMTSPAAPATLAAAEERVGPYILGPVIAHGGFSVIRKGTSPSGVVAVKIIHKSKQKTAEQEAALENEITIWSSLHHEYILPLFSTYRTDDAVFLLSLYCPAGSLFDILRLHGAPGLPQDDVGTMFRQIVRGLRYLHEQSMLIHGDIKLENVLVDELGACRIADFGLAQHITNQETREEEEEHPRTALPPHLRGRPTKHRNSTHVPGASPISLHNFPAGSLPYAAPELLLPPNTSTPNAPSLVTAFKSREMQTLRPSQHHAAYKPHPAQDIWALGCLLHALLFGRLPFVDSYEPRLQMKIVRGVWERGRSRTRSRTRGSKSRSRVRSSSRDGRLGTHPGLGMRRSSSRDGRHQHQHPGMGARRASKSRSNDVKIGKGAKKVLRGCICVDVRKRWTIAQIDEVAWNIGWEEVDEIPEGDAIMEQQGESNNKSHVSTPLSHDPNLDGGPETEWATDGEEGRSLAFQFGAGMTPILSRSKARIAAKRSETMA